MSCEEVECEACGAPVTVELVEQYRSALDAVTKERDEALRAEAGIREALEVCIESENALRAQRDALAAENVELRINKGALEGERNNLRRQLDQAWALSVRPLDDARRYLRDRGHGKASTALLPLIAAYERGERQP